MIKQSYKHSRHRQDMVRHNMKMHEHLGLFFVFAGFSWIGLGIYVTMLNANKILIPGAQLMTGNDLFLIPFFYGLGAVVTYLGIIELREVLPGKNR